MHSSWELKLTKRCSRSTNANGASGCSAHCTGVWLLISSAPRAGGKEHNIDLVRFIVGENKNMKRRGNKEGGGTNGREENRDKRKRKKCAKGEKYDKVKEIGLAHNLTIISMR